ALLPVINPLGSAPIFLSLTPGASPEMRTQAARRVALNSFLLLFGATLIGSYVLTFFGLSQAVIKIAGGLLVMSNGWHLMTADETPDAGLAPETSPHDHAIFDSKLFYPLTFPLTVGPGSMSIAITLGAATRVAGAGPLLVTFGIVLGLIV